MKDVCLGKEFFTFEQVKLSIEAYQNETGTKLYVRDSRTIESASRRAPNKKMKAELKYANLTYACIAGGRRFQSQSKGIRPNQKTLRQDCPVEIRFAVVRKDGSSLQVVSINEKHNHEYGHPNRDYPDKRRSIKRKNVSKTFENSSSLDDSSTTTTAAKFQKKNESQIEQQCSGYEAQEAKIHSLLPSLPAPTPPPIPIQPVRRQEEQVLVAPVRESGIIKQKPVEKPVPRLFVVTSHQHHVLTSLASLWKRRKLCDAAIGNGSSIIRVHKLILYALCPKLLSVSNTYRFLQVNFPKEVSKEALNAFAEYMYNGILDLDPDILKQLKIIAERLDMKEFELLCDRYFPKHIHETASLTVSSADSFTNVPLIQTNPVPTINSSLDSPGSTVSTSMLSALSINTSAINIKQETSKDEVAQEATTMLSEKSDVASLVADVFGNTTTSVVTPSIKTELVGPEDDKYGHWCDDSYVQAFTSTTPSFLSSSSVAEAAATTSIATVPSSSSTEFVIRSSESTNTKSIRLKAPHSYEAPLLSDSPPVSCLIETVCSQSSPTKKDSFQPPSQSSNSLLSVDVSKSNNDDYPVELFTGIGDNLPMLMLTEDSSDAMMVDPFLSSDKT